MEPSSERPIPDWREYLDDLCRQAHAKIAIFLRGRLGTSDLVQETLLRATKGWHRFKGTTRAEIRSWLRTVLDSVVASIRREHTCEKRDAQRETSLYAKATDDGMSLLSVLSSGTGSPEDEAARAEYFVLLAAALEELTEDQRTAVLLRHVDGLYPAEIAERMGKTTYAVHGLIKRARASLREYFASD